MRSTLIPYASKGALICSVNFGCYPVRIKRTSSKNIFYAETLIEGSGNPPQKDMEIVLENGVAASNTKCNTYLEIMCYHGNELQTVEL